MSGGVLALRHTLIREPDWSVEVLKPAEWLSSNQRGRWMVHAGDTRAWRDSGGWSAQRAKVPPMERAYILAEFRFRNRIRRDPANYYPTVKAVIDGFVDVDVLPDDNSLHLIGPDIRVGQVEPAERLLMHVWRIE